MATTQKDRAPQFTEPRDPMIHSYPPPWPPTPGRVALCGHVKKEPNARRYRPSEINCVVCVDMRPHQPWVRG